MNNFGDWLVSQREDKNISQNKLAELMGFSQAAVSRIEAGKVKPSSGFLVAAARVLNCPVEEVFRAANLLPPVTLKERLRARVEAKLEKITDPDDIEMVEKFIDMLTGGKPPSGKKIGTQRRTSP